MNDSPVAPPEHKEESLNMSDLALMANKNCRHCHGRGYKGVNVLTRDIILCKCFFDGLRRTFGKNPKEVVSEHGQPA